MSVVKKLKPENKFRGLKYLYGNINLVVCGRKIFYFYQLKQKPGSMQQPIDLKFLLLKKKKKKQLEL